MNQAKIPVEGGHLFAETVGSGPSVIFLHGGPGDTHHYMKRMAEPLFDRFRCIFFDQRGTGGSDDFARRPESFGLPVLLKDLESVQDHFQTGPAALVGHSWGAMYGLLACVRAPARFPKAALISMGPLDDEAGRAVAAHLQEALDPQEKEEWNRLRRERNEARDRGDLETVRRADREIMSLRVKTWIFNPALRSAYLEDYFRDPPPDRDVNKWIWDSFTGSFRWDDLHPVPARVWLATGAEDSTPITQAHRVSSLLGNAEVRVFERCGHLPWFEHPDSFYAALGAFLEP